MRAVLLATIFCLALTGCTTVPEQIQGEFTPVSPARVEPGVFGTEVRWGGVILSTDTSNQQTCFEILSRDLDKHLRPELEDSTAGRFIACSNGFYDPIIFSRGREVTLTGTIKTIEVQPVNDFQYRYPVLDVDQLVLWQKRQRVLVSNTWHDPWRRHWGYGYWGGWYDPWYRGWGGGGWSRTRTYEQVLLPDASIISTPTEQSQ